MLRILSLMSLTAAAFSFHAYRTLPGILLLVPEAQTREILRLSGDFHMLQSTPPHAIPSTKSATMKVKCIVPSTEVF